MHPLEELFHCKSILLHFWMFTACYFYPFALNETWFVPAITFWRICSVSQSPIFQASEAKLVWIKLVFFHFKTTIFPLWYRKSLFFQHSWHLPSIQSAMCRPTSHMGLQLRVFNTRPPIAFFGFHRSIKEQVWIIQQFDHCYSSPSHLKTLSLSCTIGTYSPGDILDLTIHPTSMR